MKLKELLQYLQPVRTEGDTEVEITGLCTDSRRVKKGDLFFCYKGGKVDSHAFMGEAARSGAAAAVCERAMDCGIPQIIVGDARAQVARAARAFYGFPDKKLTVVGVTGTNGKTTTTFMLESIFKAAGRRTGVIGTLGVRYADKMIAPELTTPDPVYLYSVLSDMAAAGVEYVFMEVSAHALYYGKTGEMQFAAGIFTNCTQDHLDFFGTMEEYAAAKRLLFREGRCAKAVVNSDDALGVELLSAVRGAASYGIDNPADVFAVDIREGLDGTRFVLNLFDELYEIRLRIPALHNVYNAMAAAACAKTLGIRIETIAKGLSALETVPGRLELVAKYNGAFIFVDFAHTPDGLKKSLQSLKNLCRGKLYCLFGCGGNRDKGKRPLMGEVAAQYADFCIVTSDNPRFEDPFDIICDIEKGIRPTGKKYVAVTEREIATEYAIRLLDRDDILLVAGKGGEDYQEIMGIKHSYNDNTVIKTIIGA